MSPKRPDRHLRTIARSTEMKQREEELNPTNPRSVGNDYSIDQLATIIRV